MGPRKFSSIKYRALIIVKSLEFMFKPISGTASVFIGSDGSSWKMVRWDEGVRVEQWEA